MKKLSSLLAIILLAVCNTLSGRTPENAPKLSVEETLRAAPEKAGGLMYVYDYKEDATTTPSLAGISGLQVHGTMPSKPMWRPLPFQEPPSASRSFQSTGTLTKVLPVNCLLRRFLRHRALSESQGS